MRPLMHPRLVNGRFGDPALFVEILHQRSALLFDMGDLSALSARDLLRITHVCISHMHIDHFIGFDALLRVAIGREKRIEMVGPAGFIDAVGHRLAGYSWDLVDRYETDLVFDVTELVSLKMARHARFRFKAAFARENRGEHAIDGGMIIAEPGFRVTAAILEHHGACLGFAIAEPVHINVWKNRLDERRLATGAWLQPLKKAVRDGLGDAHPIRLPDGSTAPVGQLRDLLSIGPGQKIAYVTDVADTAANRAAIAALAEGADIFFIESRFAAADRDQAARRAHLTTTAAGEIARRAGVRRVEPFHFSPRYEQAEQAMLIEVQAAFAGEAVMPDGAQPHGLEQPIS
ncbi:ribonuclease Z [Sphingomonas oleivorans]|uniref:Ribonuclease Z n=1 Tax=Sphingomonas oleivorans TaxID=1735121 RepID=A0A2T5G1Z2_9SPHN|nr:MBL fold metallo-hydrolase [Sphingomonas oleivorans]PTQ13177.1 ribonuclease Z [Sphingomonas oleivorans]